MNFRKILRSLKNFLVPTPATVRRHRAPSARFSTLEALAKTHGDTLTRDGRSYQLVTADLRVLEFDNLAQVKGYLSGATVVSGSENSCLGYHAAMKNFSGKDNVSFSRLDEADRADGGPYPGDADYVERPRNLYKITGPSPEVPQEDNYDIGEPPDIKTRHVYKIDANGALKPCPATDVRQSAPFVPVAVTPIAPAAVAPAAVAPSTVLGPIEKGIYPAGIAAPTTDINSD